MDLAHQLFGIGIESKDLNLLQISLRGTVVFFGALIIVRVANKRFLSKMAALDVILGFILASMLARAVNGSAPLFSTLGGALLLVLLHRGLAWLSNHSSVLELLVKGRPDTLIENGRVNRQALEANSLSGQDLKEELHQEGQVESEQDVKAAYLERSGKVSVIPAKKKS